MEKATIDLLKTKCSQQSYDKLFALNNDALNNFVTKYAQLCNPDTIYICNDSSEDKEYIKKKTIENKEEKSLAITGHSAHFDGFFDQARDKGNTKYLLAKDTNLGPVLNGIDKETGSEEINGYLKNIMAGKTMYVLFFCLGPVNSPFSLSCVQITDSSYVAHSEYILYRPGYAQFAKLGNSDNFFKYVHSAGVLENGVSKNIDQRRVYIDLDNSIVYSTNTQYAGNTVGLKKLSLRLAIRKAANEGWLAEHMLVMGINGPGGRKTYFSGAFPSACGKTSTAMVKGENIVGDDIAYLRKINGTIHGTNVECGIFGIIRDVNPKDDPIIWEALTTPGEVIFSNILVTKDGKPYWLGDGRKAPESGINFSGEWQQGKKDDQGKDIGLAHKNARYTVSLYALKNVDKELDNTQGVPIKGIIYGGRDSSVWPPVRESFDWDHGVITMGGSLESETTAATLGKEGVRQFNPMSNLDFLALPLGQYIDNHLKFAADVQNKPTIFAVNYFLKDKDGSYLTAMEDKRVWVKWMELKVNGDVTAIKTPIGLIPKYSDLQKLFKEVLNKDYTEADYNEQFSLRVKENIDKIDRITEIYKTKAADAPKIIFETLEKQKQELVKAKEEHGDYIKPETLAA